MHSVQFTPKLGGSINLSITNVNTKDSLYFANTRSMEGYHDSKIITEQEVSNKDILFEGSNSLRELLSIIIPYKGNIIFALSLL